MFKKVPDNRNMRQPFRYSEVDREPYIPEIVIGQTRIVRCGVQQGVQDHIIQERHGNPRILAPFSLD